MNLNIEAWGDLKRFLEFFVYQDSTAWMEIHVTEKTEPAAPVKDEYETRNELTTSCY